MQTLKEIYLEHIIDQLGQTRIAKACGVSRQTVHAWQAKGSLPDTEYLTPKHPKRTHYAKIIAKMAGCKAADLL